MVREEFLERELVEAARRRDRAAFKRLYELNAPIVFDYARRRVSFHEAEDITAEVFSAAWRKLPDFQWRGVPLRGWLLTIARNEIRGRARHNSKLRFQPLQDDPARSNHPIDIEDGVLATLNTEVIVDALGLLAEQNRLVLEYRFLQELKVGEVAQKLGISEENVRVRTFRALKQLHALTVGEIDEF